MKKFMKKYGFITLMLLGIVAGCIVGAAWPGATALEPFGTLFINMMFCVVVPMVFCSIASAIANMKSVKRAGKIMGVTVATFLVTAAIAGVLMYIVCRIFPLVDGQYTIVEGEVGEALGFGDMIVNFFTKPDFMELLSRRAILPLIVAAVLYPNSRTAGAEHVNYQPLFVVVSALMAVSVIVLYFTTNEPKLAAAEKEYEAEHPEQQLVEEEPDGSEELPKEVKRSLVMLLCSIALWYIGYNGVTTWWTTYVGRVMGQGLGGASTCLLVATGGAIVSYIPVGQLASKIGRKKTIQGGVILLAACFASAYFLTTHYQSINAVMFVVFALVGLAWAAINVNSLPMVVEMCKGSDIGKFTGYYYTFSMAAQVVTPILAGTLLKHISYSMLFPYAAFFVACSFVTMCFVRHGDCKVEAKAGLAAFEDMDAD